MSVRDTGTGGETRDLGSGETGAQPGAGGVLPLAASQPFFTDSPRSASGGPISDERRQKYGWLPAKLRDEADYFDADSAHERYLNEAAACIEDLLAVLTQQEAALALVRHPDDVPQWGGDDWREMARRICVARSAALEGTQE